MLEPVFESALAHRAPSESTYVAIREISNRGMIDLRGSASDRKFMAAVKEVLGFDLPKEPRSSKAFGELKALWFSPDQWLVMVPRDKALALAEKLSKALSAIHALAIDVSDMRAIIRLEGESVREVMMKSGSLDFLDGNFVPGHVRRMRFAEIPALIHIVEDQVIDLYVFRSQAQYAMDFLEKAARKGSEVGLFRKA